MCIKTKTNVILKAETLTEVPYYDRSCVESNIIQAYSVKICQLALR